MNLVIFSPSQVLYIATCFVLIAVGSGCWQAAIRVQRSCRISNCCQVPS